MISSATMVRIYQLLAKKVRLPYCPKKPKMSKPALQNAETAVNTDIQIPFAPNRGTKAAARAIAPISSKPKLVCITRYSIFLVPAASSRLIDSLASIILLKPSFLRSARLKKAVSVTRPRPPIWISSRITACPKTVNFEKVS